MHYEGHSTRWTVEVFAAFYEHQEEFSCSYDLFNHMKMNDDMPTTRTLKPQS